MRFASDFFRISFPAPLRLSFFLCNLSPHTHNHFVLRIILIIKILRISALWIQKYCIVMLFIINLRDF
ncbi:TPA_asm: hypothetical protein G0D16_01140 [Salmonella bongori serovar 44:r:-]|uniref:Uncharacterized protein n=1 Tax=Salmonella bongori serovar 44:r:- TaxID=1967585 RepID=A0A702BJY8_SALBN|nr:hypothetical protein [Salmonella bongori serovar 44:r:-]